MLAVLDIVAVGMQVFVFVFLSTTIIANNYWKQWHIISLILSQQRRISPIQRF